MFDRQATSAVEFALLAPIFLILFFGLTAYGIYIGASHSVQQVAADAARSAIAGIDTSERVHLATGFVSRNGGGYSLLDGRHLSVEAGHTNSDPTQFFITVSYDARNLPIWNLLGGMPMPATMIQRRSVIRIGGQ